MSAQASHLPLKSHAAFPAGNGGSLAAPIDGALAAKIATVADVRDFERGADYHKLPNSGLWLHVNGVSVALPFPEGDFVRVRFHRDGFQQVLWRIPRQVLVQKLAALAGRPVLYDIDFESAFRPESPESALVLQLLDSLLHAIETVEGDGADIIIGELEQALITAFLVASRHDGQDRLETKPRGAAPWQVHRAESYIEQNWDKPITIEDLAAETGASARSIFRAFKQSRGYTPLEFARTIRLGHARRMLESEDCGSVTEVAFACGFSDLGRFAKDFTQAFGERPSAVLRRKKAMLSAN